MEKKEEPVRQVFQGKVMGEGASFFERASFQTVQPLIDCSQSQVIRFEQLGNTPEHLKIDQLEQDVENHIKQWVESNPKDRFALLKGLLSFWKKDLMILFPLHFILNASSVLEPLIIASVVEWAQSTESETFEQTMRMVAFAALLPILRIVTAVVNQPFHMKWVLTGHRAHWVLKTILFRKSFRLTNATNKQYSSSEITQIVVHDTLYFSTFIEFFPLILMCVFNITTGAFVVFKEIGYCGFIMLGLSALRMYLQYLKGKQMAKIDKEQNQKRQQRTLFINESFTNIKTVKLFGWEPDFLTKVDDVFQEELAVEDQSDIMAMIFQFFGDILQVSINFFAFSAYIWLGNQLTMSKLMLTSIYFTQISTSISMLEDGIQFYFRTKEVF